MPACGSGSLALLSDAGHNFTDALALLLAAIGVYLQGKPADHTKTFGYQRAGVIAAFLNAATLMVISLLIFWEAGVRIIHPEPVNDADDDLGGGCRSRSERRHHVALHSGQKGDINIRAAFIHMMGDALGAVAIIIGAIAIRYTRLDVYRSAPLHRARPLDHLHGLGHRARITEHSARRAAARHSS